MVALNSAKPFAAFLDELVVLPAVFEDDVHEAVDEGDVRSGAMAQMQRGELSDVDPARIGDHQLDAALEHRLADARPEHRVLFGGVRADNQDGLGIPADVVKGIAHGAGAVAHRQSGHGRGMTKPGAVVDVVRADHLARELLRQIVFFVGALGG